LVKETKAKADGDGTKTETARASKSRKSTRGGFVLQEWKKRRAK